MGHFPAYPYLLVQAWRWIVAVVKIDWRTCRFFEATSLAAEERLSLVIHSNWRLWNCQKLLSWLFGSHLSHQTILRLGNDLTCQQSSFRGRSLSAVPQVFQGSWMSFSKRQSLLVSWKDVVALKYWWVWILVKWYFIVFLYKLFSPCTLRW